MDWNLHLEGKDCQIGAGLGEAEFNFMPFTRETPKSVKLQKVKIESQGIEKTNSSEKKAGVALLIPDTYTLRRQHY